MPVITTLLIAVYSSIKGGGGVIMENS